MRLFEMTETSSIPRRLGLARLVLGEGINVPERDGDVITLPYDAEWEFFLLNHEGKEDQFILSNARANRHWFGGTDEKPFLVQVDANAVKCYCQFGPLRDNHFYASLRWREVDELSCGTHRKWRRQGDIFAVPLGVSWKTLMGSFKLTTPNEHSMVDVGNNGDYNVFETRHVLSGQMLVSTSRVTIYGVGVVLVASGVVRAPDHRDLELGDMPHALYQAANLVNPANAD